MTNRQFGVLVIGYTSWFFLFRWLVSLYPSLGLFKTFGVFYLISLILGFLAGLFAGRKQNLIALALSLPTSLGFLANIIYEKMLLLRTERLKTLEEPWEMSSTEYLDLTNFAQAAKLELVKTFAQGIGLMLLGIILTNVVCSVFSKLGDKRASRYRF
ncbi:MAG TPA: hypothetical protein GXX38_05180 [Clostridia bacterium]|jgi:cbb3-type cytochrome oxidase subunit 3|nr:hypothetical protein [Clostridia bacterium]